MSLVAAYSDSESESDADDGDKSLSVQPVNRIDVASHPIVADQVKDKSTNVIKDTEQIHRNVLASSIDDIVDDDDNINHNVNVNSNLFSILPQPKAKISAVVEESDDEFIRKGIEINTDIDEEKPTKRKSLILPSPAQKSNKKQPVKILIPSLEEIGADSDSDDEKSKEKEKQPIKRKTTLFSILPKPKHSVTVGANRNKVFSFEANRPLIPHTLTKKKDDAKKDKPKPVEKKKGLSLVGDISGSDEENDDEDVGSSTNFFSLSDSKSNSTSNILELKSEESNKIEAKRTSIKPERTSIQPEKATVVNNVTRKEKTILDNEKSISSNNKQSVADSNKKENSFFSNLYKSNSNVDKLTSETNKVEKSLGTGDRTLDTSVDKGISAAPYSNALQSNSRKGCPDETAYSSVTAPYSSVTAPYPSSNVAPYGNVSSSYGETNSSYGNTTGAGSIPEKTGTNEKNYPTASNFFSYAYHKNEPAHQSVETNVENSEIDYYNKPNEDLPIDKDALRALQGSKRRREDINLIDIHADDIQANSSDYLKNLTAESAEQQRLMARKDKDQPTSSQKRKHQITYLAHQAKERELQLQQAWAESLASKRQTQSKYGF